MTRDEIQRQLVERYGEEGAKKLMDAWAALPATAKDREELKARAQEVQKSDSPESYRHFFWCMTRMELPLHAYYGFVIPQYWAKGRLTRAQLDTYFAAKEAEPFQFIYRELCKYAPPKVGVVIYATREFAKTITGTQWFTAYRIGKEPHRANMVIQIGDDSAKFNVEKVATGIATYEGWKACFPNVVPDTKWGADGYHVKDTSDPNWDAKIAARQGPSLVGLGYTSGAILGKHPDGVLAVDDINDENNTASGRELDKVLTIIQDVIFYAMTNDTWPLFIGTPWVAGDVLDFVARTGEYVVIKVPAYLEKDGEEYVVPKDWKEGAEDKLFLWPSLRGYDWVLKRWKTSTPQAYRRMVLLNLDRTGVEMYKWQSFDHTRIDWDWPVVVGVDPVGVYENVNKREAGSSHFAAAHVFLTPYNSVVVGGGFVEKCSADEGERHLVAAKRKYKNVNMFSIEMNGVGAPFAALVSRHPELRVSPHKVSELGAGNKKTRQYNFLEPYLKNGLVTISDEDTPFLNRLRSYLNRYPNIDMERDPEADVADALCMALLDVPAIRFTNITGDIIRHKKPERKSMWADVGRIGV